MGFCMWACASRVAKKASVPAAAALCATAAFTLLSGEQPRSLPAPPEADWAGSPAPGGLACRCTADHPYIMPAAAEAVCRGTARRARGCHPACNRVVPRPCAVHVRGSVSQRQPPTSLRLPPFPGQPVWVGPRRGLSRYGASATSNLVWGRHPHEGHGAPWPYHSCGGALRRYAEGQHASCPALRPQTRRKTCKL